MEKNKLITVVQEQNNCMGYISIQDQINQAMVDCHEKVLKDVLRQLLKREPVLEDAKRLTRYTYQGVFEYYDLAFDGVKVGRVTYGGASVVFEPVELK